MFFMSLYLFMQATIAISLISISGFGAVLTTSQKANTLESIFFGFPLIALIVTFISLFFNISIQIILIVFLGRAQSIFFKKIK